MSLPVALPIATSDSGGGAGIQADIKAMQANGVFAASILVASTAQNTQEVRDVHAFPTEHIEHQFDAVATDLDVRASKIGMLFSADIIETVARKVEEHGLRPLVVDPVMISSTGFKLLQDDAVDALRQRLFPLAALLTPNAHEAAHLAGHDVHTLDDACRAAETLHEQGAPAVLVKGGHLDGEDEAVDVLFDGTGFAFFRSPRYDTPHTHGSGCTYASATAAHLALGASLTEAIERAKRYLDGAIRHGLALGHGHGPTDHFWFLREEVQEP